MVAAVVAVEAVSAVVAVAAVVAVVAGGGSRRQLGGQLGGQLSIARAPGPARRRPHSPALSEITALLPLEAKLIDVGALTRGMQSTHSCWTLTLLVEQVPDHRDLTTNAFEEHIQTAVSWIWGWE